MTMTYKKLAEIVGVSRATVDRVIHNRGHVSPDVERRVRQAAELYGFRPSHVGRALAKAGNPVKIGVLVHLTRIPFFQSVLEGIQDAQTEIANLGGKVIVKQLETLDPEAQIKALDALVEEGVQGIAISPSQSVALLNRLNQLAEDKHLPIVTFNTDLEGLKRLSYVGVDNTQVGRASAYLMDLLQKGRSSNILIVSGFLTHQTNYQRVDGFVMECGMYYPGIKVVGVEMTYDDPEQAYKVTSNALHNMPDLDGIFMVSSGQEGCCRAIEDAGKTGKVKLIVVDSLPETDEFLRKGVIQFIVDQDAYSQGNIPPKVLFDALFSNQKPEEKILGQIGVKTRHTVQYNGFRSYTQSGLYQLL